MTSSCKNVRCSNTIVQYNIEVTLLVDVRIHQVVKNNQSKYYTVDKFKFNSNGKEKNFFLENKQKKCVKHQLSISY